MRITTITDVKPRRKNAAFRQLMFLHWIMAPCFLLLYGTGVIVPRLPKQATVAAMIPFLHQSFGILVIILLIARIFLLLRLIRHKYSRLPKITLLWLKKLVLNIALYLFMLLVPISGLLFRNLEGIDTTFFGIFVPSFFSKDERLVELARNVHFWASYLFLSFIILHLLAQQNFIRTIWNRVYRYR